MLRYASFPAICVPRIRHRFERLNTNISDVTSKYREFSYGDLFRKCLIEYRDEHFIFFNCDHLPECEQFAREHSFAGADLHNHFPFTGLHCMCEGTRRPGVNKEMLSESGPSHIMYVSSSSNSERLGAFGAAVLKSRVSISSRNSDGSVYSREPYFIRSAA